MAMEDIRRVAEAESAQQLQYEEMLAQSKRKIALTHHAGERMLEESRQISEGEAKKTIATAEEESVSKAKAVLDQAEEECAALKAAARANLEAAAARIAERVVNS